MKQSLFGGAILFHIFDSSGGKTRTVGSADEPHRTRKCLHFLAEQRRRSAKNKVMSAMSAPFLNCIEHAAVEKDEVPLSCPMKLAKAYIKFHSYNIVKPSKILKKRKVIKYWPVILVTISLLVAATTVYALFLEPRDYRTFDSDTSPSSDISVGVAPYSANVSLSENPAFKRVTVSLAGGKYSDKANFPITDLLKYSNQHRASSGLNKLTINQKLSQSAQLKCEDMVMNNYWSHISPNGSEPWIFYEKVGYKYRIAGENLAYGYIRPSTLLEGWMMSPSHRESILSSEYVDVGFGVCETPYYLNRGHFVIVVQHFGTPR